MTVKKAESLKKLAQSHGFDLLESVTDYAVGAFHRERQEGFQAFFSDDGSLSDATWHAEDEWVIMADTRANPKRNVRDDAWLTGSSKMRPAGVDQIHWKLASSRSGIAVKEMELRRRIKKAGAS